ncbi:hypothetical protein DV515_00012374 [Chloebia gouldiae]|uniref:Uncharacterized protein n=1 Tax=Chloebia gouldiae TaxID=44316 RepID=A0A3L8S4U4_CHLGU|nr:hypothetical protein DV515_00012374 [Chloebia gouldiae]
MHPQTLNVSHYRFPSRGQSYISIPSEAFHGKAWITIVGLLYHNMHYFFDNIDPLHTRIAEAAAYKGYMISASSFLISIKVEPLPQLSHNLSGSPLITIQLTHRLHLLSIITSSLLHSCCSWCPLLLLPWLSHSPLLLLAELQELQEQLCIPRDAAAPVLAVAQQCIVLARSWVGTGECWG